MAECHPVGFQWVMEAKARGATVIHIDPRFTRTSAVADLHVPLRAGTDIALLGGLDQPRAEQRAVVPRVRVALHQRGHHHQRGLPGHRGPRRAVLRLRPRAAPLRPGQLAYEGAEVQAASGERDKELRRRRPGRARSAVSAAGRGEAHGSGGAHVGHAARPTRRCSTRAACSRSSSGTTRATPPRWSSRPAGSPQATFRAGLRADHRELGPGADHRLGLQRRLDPAHRRRAVHPRRRRSCSRCSATSAGRAAGSWRCAGTPRIQGSTDIPTLFDLLPGLHPDAARAHQREPRRVHRRPRAPTRGSGRTCAPTPSACSRRGGATRATGGERLLLRLPAPADRQPLAPTRP